VDGHAADPPAAEAAACAADQGKFWPYHDRLFQDASKLDQGNLKRNAAELGLDTAKFDACVDSHKLKSTVDADLQAGSDAGVDGTPAFFINGVSLTGAVPLAEFEKIIDAELAK
jgi:protein-disulfide isomerase